jgi:hypothetical protein
VFKIVLAVILFVVVLRVGIGMIRAIGSPLPPPPPPGELRRVNLRYRCTICGAEVRMTSAPDELPEPPRHCLEDMEPVAPAIE